MANRSDVLRAVRPIVRRMSPAHPQVQPLLDAMAAMEGPKLHELSPVDAWAMFVDFPGGGRVIGNIENHAAPCREIAARSGCAVVSVGYRLSPETPYPGPLDDCVAVTEWVATNGNELGVDGSRLVVAGDSAGGNLAAAVTLVAKQRGGPSIAAQVLVYPATDLTLSHPSMVENGEGYFLTADAMRWFVGHYGGDAATDPLVSPLVAA